MNGNQCPSCHMVYSFNCFELCALYICCEAHIPPETASMLGTQHKQKVHKQHEIDVPNANPMRKLANTTIFHQNTNPLALGCFALLSRFMSNARK